MFMERWKTSEDMMTLKHVSIKVREWVSEEFTSCQLVLLGFEQSSCYAVSWRDRHKGNYLGKCNTHNMVHKNDLVSVSDAQNNLTKCEQV